MIKTIQTREEAYLQFSEDEMIELGLNKGQKFSWIAQEDGSFLLKPHKKVEIDLSEFPRELLESMISESIEKDISINEVVNNAIETYIEDELG